MKKFLLLFCLIAIGCPQSVFAEEISVSLEKCVDGDTAKFKTEAGEVMSYRFLAIDTPETVHPTKQEEPWGKEASEYTCTSLTNATSIVLEFDDASERVDHYNRGLAWVFVDGVLLQEQLVGQGFAKVAYLYGDYKYTERLQANEKIAQANKLGIWSEEEPLSSAEQKKEENTSTPKGNFLEQILSSILETITASINQMIDSILQKLENML